MSSAFAVLIIMPLAFGVGFAKQRRNVCSVLAARQIAETGKATRLVAFLTSSLWALVVVVPLGWLTAGATGLSPTYEDLGLAVSGGALYGLGTFINGACGFGTAARVFSGKLSFLAAFPGMALGAGLAVRTLEQSDATGWMGMFCLNLMRIALELAKENRVYEGLAVKFFQHYTYVASAMKHMGNRNYQLWDEHDGFFYDVLRYPDGRFRKFRVRSLVGLIPLFAVERLEVDWIQQFKEFTACLDWFLRNRAGIVDRVVHKTKQPNGDLTYVLTIVDQDQLQRLLDRVYDADEFLSDYGIRSLSKAHEAQPFELDGRVVGYEPAEAASKLKGGNSNWRGPIWFPTSFLLIDSLRKLGKAYGPNFQLRTPATRDRVITFSDMAQDLADRMIRIFARDGTGRRPVYGGARKFQEDAHWRDHILFYEYFHGDNGAGLGASHQTGWTALVASLIDEWRR